MVKGKHEMLQAAPDNQALRLGAIRQGYPLRRNVHGSNQRDESVDAERSDGVLASSAGSFARIPPPPAYTAQHITDFGFKIAVDLLF